MNRVDDEIHVIPLEWSAMFDLIEIRDDMAKLVKKQLRMIITIRWGVVVGDEFNKDRTPGKSGTE